MNPCVKFLIGLEIADLGGDIDHAQTRRIREDVQRLRNTIAYSKQLIAASREAIAETQDLLRNSADRNSADRKSADTKSADANRPKPVPANLHTS